MDAALDMCVVIPDAICSAIETISMPGILSLFDHIEERAAGKVFEYEERIAVPEALI